MDDYEGGGRRGSFFILNLPSFPLWEESSCSSRAYLRVVQLLKGKRMDKQCMRIVVRQGGKDNCYFWWIFLDVWHDVC